jgi:hypothetical protein
MLLGGGRTLGLDVLSENAIGGDGQSKSHSIYIQAPTSKY